MEGMPLTSAKVKELARAAGFEISGIAAAEPLSDDFQRFQQWREAGFAAEMSYLTDRRGDLRADPRNLLPSAKCIVCLGKLYNTSNPYSTAFQDKERGWIARYAWGRDYHDVLREAVEKLLHLIRQEQALPFEWKICVDTAPLLERSYAQAAGLGWIGKNTCLINQQAGSWFLLAELLLSISLDTDTAAPPRCGTCTRCIDACPTDAIRPAANGGWALDSRLCLSYLTIEKRGVAPEETQSATANHIFGCDICQDVCPWNRRAATTEELAFQPLSFAPHLAELAYFSEGDFRRIFRRSPVWRTKYEGFLRNVAVALGNSGKVEMKEPLQKLSAHDNELVASTARAALARLEQALAV
jgi:epoxyqueuosine reductase